jgi:hypothetical protein
MRRLTASRVLFGVFLLISLIFAVTAYRLVLTNLPEFVPLFIFWLLAFVKMLYDASDNVYLAVNRVIAWLTSATANWEFTIQYVIETEQDSVLQLAADSILDVFPKAQLWQDDPTQKIVHAPSFTARIKILREVSPEETDLLATNLFVDLTNMNVSYRNADRMLSRTIAPLLEKLFRNISAGWVKYTLRIKYDGANPFFGLYIKKLPLHQVAKFHCELFEVVGSETDNITIGKEETVIITTSITSLLTLSQKYLSLSSSSSS